VKQPALRRVDDATVWKADRAAGHLRRTAQGVTFAYLPDYDGPDVATSLPRGSTPAPRGAGALPPFFSGLLPEGRRLQAIRRATKTSVDDELTLLLAVGSDTIGDVRILPAGVTREQRAVEAMPPGLTDVAFDELFASVLGPELRDRVGLPGVQDKVSGRMISLPVSHHGGEYILKLDPPEVPHLVANEAFFLRAARACGIDTADTTILHDRDGKPGLLVRRFDRVPGDAGLPPRSLAQEDACQVLSRYPADKYLMSTEEVILGLAKWTSAPVVAARAWLRQFAFAYLTGNGDAHAKNFSIVFRNGEWLPTPAYDLPSSLPYRDNNMALSINGKDRENIGRRDFLALGSACGVLPKATERVLDELLAALPVWLDHLVELPFDRRTLHQMEKACRYRERRLRG
jgi:serine/threonine-protein kinase HipA